MSSAFEKYSDILLDAFESNARSGEVAAKKKEILDELFGHYDIDPDTVLFVGFSPGLLKLDHAKLYVTEVSDTVTNYLRSTGRSVEYVDRNNSMQ